MDLHVIRSVLFLPRCRRPAVVGFVMMASLFGVGARAASVSDSVPGPVPARVVAVIDGDTIEVEARIWVGQAVVTRVRLLGIDAPERDGKCADERALGDRARAAVVDLIGEGAVTLTDIRYGKYAGRVLAKVATENGVDLSDALLHHDLARVYDGGRRRGWCP